MAASWLKLASVLGVASALCSLIPSCADNNQSIFIRQVQALRAPECIVNSDPAALVVSSGFVDVGIAQSYVIHPLVGNQLLARANANQSRSETNRVAIEGAEIELVDPDGSTLSLGALPNPFTVVANGTVDPSVGEQATYGVASVEVLPPAFIAAYRSVLAPGGIGASRTINAKIRIFGHTLGNTEVETGVFTFPIQTCYGCGVVVPADAVDPSISLRNCKGTVVGGGSNTRTVCSLGTDALTDCRMCQGAVPLCTPCVSNDDCGGMRSTTNPSAAAVCNTTAGFCE